VLKLFSCASHSFMQNNAEHMSVEQEYVPWRRTDEYVPCDGERNIFAVSKVCDVVTLLWTRFGGGMRVGGSSLI
jgi:hypothetical protein